MLLGHITITSPTSSNDVKLMVPLLLKPYRSATGLARGPSNPVHPTQTQHHPQQPHQQQLAHVSESSTPDLAALNNESPAKRYSAAIVSTASVPRS